MGRVYLALQRVASNRVRCAQCQDRSEVHTMPELMDWDGGEPYPNDPEYVIEDKTLPWDNTSSTCHHKQPIERFCPLCHLEGVQWKNMLPMTDPPQFYAYLEAQWSAEERR